jgi:hypothetical protein
MGRLVDALGIHRPRIVAIHKLRLQGDEFFQVVVVERIGLTEIAAGVEFVEPDFPRWRALLEE